MFLSNAQERTNCSFFSGKSRIFGAAFSFSESEYYNRITDA